MQDPELQKCRAPRLTPTTALHYWKLTYRSLLFLVALIFYILRRVQDREFSYDTLSRHPWLLITIGLVFVFEMVLRFFPSRLESMGCQKQFARNYRPRRKEEGPATRPKLGTAKTTFLVALVWLLLNGAIGVLYYTHLIDEGILLLIALAYSVCDMICILFFCPFQTWIMKNRCCVSCRIYNWDFAMMFTPFVFLPRPFTWTLLGIALLLLIYWEIMVHLYPERFMIQHNAALSCSGCTEKLCHHKRQLRGFLSRHKEFGWRKPDWLKLREALRAKARMAKEKLTRKKKKTDE